MKRHLSRKSTCCCSQILLSYATLCRLSEELEQMTEKKRESKCYLKPPINSTGRARKIPSDFPDPLAIAFVSRRAPIAMRKDKDTCRAFPNREKERERIRLNAPWRGRYSGVETQIHIIPSARALCNRRGRIDVTIDSDRHRNRYTSSRAPIALLIGPLRIAQNKIGEAKTLDFSTLGRSPLLCEGKNSNRRKTGTQTKKKLR